jgi:hypothetical protein
MRSSAYYTILAPGTKSTPIRVFQTRLWNAANDACFVAAPLLGQKVPVFDHFVHSREVTGSRPTFMSCARAPAIFDYPRRKGSRVRRSRVSGVAKRRTALQRACFSLKLREKVAHSGAACASRLFSAVFAVTLFPSDI